MDVMTIGHSTRSVEELAGALSAHGVTWLVDVRRFPGSRRHPQFSRSALSESLPAAGIAYTWREELGGRRRRRQESPHSGWRVAGFAAYADHMDTPEFRAAMRDVLARARSERVALMCAEARPEQCHRRLIADWLVAQGAAVWHIRDARRATPHELPAFARVEGEGSEARVIYDGSQPDLL